MNGAGRRQSTAIRIREGASDRWPQVQGGSAASSLLDSSDSQGDGLWVGQSPTFGVAWAILGLETQ